MSVTERIKKLTDDETELNLDGIIKPDLSILTEKADLITELSLNACKLNSLSSLPTLPALFKLQLNDNNLANISDLPTKCPGLIELSLSGNKKIASLDTLKSLSELKTLLKLELEGCDVADDEGYRKSIFGLVSSLANIDGLDARGNEVPDDDDDDEEDEEEDEADTDDEGDAEPGLATLYSANLPSDDEDDGDYDSNEEPQGSDGDNSEGEIEQPQGGNDEGAGSSGLSSGPPPKRLRKDEDSDSD